MFTCKNYAFFPRSVFVFSYDAATKLMQFLKVAGIDWGERRLISRLYVDQSIKLKLDRGETRRVTSKRGVRQGCCLSPNPFKSYSE